MLGHKSHNSSWKTRSLTPDIHSASEFVVYISKDGVTRKRSKDGNWCDWADFELKFVAQLDQQDAVEGRWVGEISSVVSQELVTRYL